MRVTGVTLAIMEMGLFLLGSIFFRNNFRLFSSLNSLSYFWIMFTIMTGIWEFFYINNRFTSKKISDMLLRTNTHVWTNTYHLSNLSPNFFSNLFYAEYAAYADREYMKLDDIWSLEIEGSHCILCGLINFVAMIFYFLNVPVYLLLIIVSMSGQLMNSLLYCGQYLIQIKNKNNVNYPTLDFPSGKYLSKRPFIYINIFWTIMPVIVLYGIITKYSIFIIT